MKVTILGTGAYGLALSKILIDNNQDVVMWTTFEKEKEELIHTRMSSKLKDFKLDNKVKITTSLQEAIINSELIVIAIPTEFISNVCKEMKKYIKKDQHICIASKGIEQNSFLFISDIIKKEIKTKNIGVISGPSFAIDLVKSVPIGLSCASKNKNTIKKIKLAFSNNHFNLYSTNDIIGIEICGAIKNVVALASGMIEGMGYPISTQALFITKSLQDIQKLIYELGGSKNTVQSLAGFGDILLTCTSSKSRNYTYGKMIGNNSSVKELEDYKKSFTIEGIYTLKSIYKLIIDQEIDIPLINIIYDIIFNNSSKDKLIQYLLS